MAIGDTVKVQANVIEMKEALRDIRQVLCDYDPKNTQYWTNATPAEIVKGVTKMQEELDWRKERDKEEHKVLHSIFQEDKEGSRFSGVGEYYVQGVPRLFADWKRLKRENEEFVRSLTEKSAVVICRDCGHAFKSVHDYHMHHCTEDMKYG